MLLHAIMPPYFSFACYTFDDEKISTLHFNPTDIALYGGIVLEWCSGSRETQPLIIFSPPHYPLLGPTGVNPCSDLGSAFVLRSAAGLGWAGLACCEVVMWVETGALKPPVPGAGSHCPHLLQLVDDGDPATPPRHHTAAAQWSWCCGR